MLHQNISLFILDMPKKYRISVQVNKNILLYLETVYLEIFYIWITIIKHNSNLPYN